MRTLTAIVLTGAIALAALPDASRAAGRDAAVNACVNNFVQTTLPKDTVVHVRKPRYVPSPLAFHHSRKSYTIELTARSKSGDPVAHAKCVASRQGYVILLDTKTQDVFWAG